MLTMLIIGSVVGAGFASGAEIIYFFEGFGSYAWVAIIMSAALFALYCATFLRLGRILGEKSLSKFHFRCFGRAGWIADLIIVLNSMILGASMLAAVTGISKIALPNMSLPILAAVAAIICALVLERGAKGVARANSVLSPIICIMLIAAAIIGMDSSAHTGIVPAAFPMPLIYTGMNITLAGGVLALVDEKGKGAARVASGAAGVVLCVLMLCIFYAVRGSGTSKEDMPLLSMLKGKSTAFFYLMLIVTLAAVWSTLLLSVYNASGWIAELTGKAAAVPITLGICFLVSFLGFSNIVRYINPVFGVAGTLYAVGAIRALKAHKL